MMNLKRTRTLRLRVDQLLREKSVVEKREIPQVEVALSTRIPPGVISRYVNNAVRRYDANTLEKLMDYFGVGIDQMFVIEENRS